MTCPACGAGNRPGARFCLECGTALVARCASCNAELPDRAKYCDGCGTSVEPGAPASTPAVARKVVSVVFADLEGSTALQEALDAESVRRLMDEFYGALRGAIEAHGGTVVKFIGDGVMAGFGIGAVSEDDAWRSVQAATAMQDAFTALGWSPDVALRVGVNTGEVIVTEGDADVVGDAVNVAARLESAAARGGILVGEETWRLTRHRAQYEEVTPLELRGKARPVPAYRLLGTTAPLPDPSAPFVGREAELRGLAALLDDVVGSRVARLATVLGSPGMGKSRLASEFVAGLGLRATVLEARFSATATSTFGPVIDVLRSAVGDPMLDERVAGSPQEAFLAIRRVIETMAAERPVVLVLEDLHWAEPLMLDLVDHLVEWIRDAPVLLLALARPELREARPALVETGRRAAQVVVLEGLDPEASERLACDLLETDQLPTALVARVLAGSEGNPLFVRELVRMLVDDGVLRQDGAAWRTTIDVDAITVPPTIQSLLAARVERLTVDERTVLECAAVVGREFYRGAVAALVAPAVRRDLDLHLERLRQKEMVEPAGAYWIDEPVLRFHHVLLRDAAYRRLLKEARAELHERFAEWLEAKVGGDGENDDVLGYHLESAHQYRVDLGIFDDHTAELGRHAALRLANAGRRALDRDDLPAAAALLGRALGRVDGDDPDRAALLIDRCEALIATGDLADADLALGELREMVGGSARLRAWSDAFSSQLAILTQPGRLEETATAVEQAAGELAKLGDTAGAAKAHAVHAAALARLGRVGECEAALDRALAAAREAGDTRRATGVLAGAPLAALWGPSPVARASGRCLDVVRVLRITTSATTVEATSLRCQAVLEALRGRTDAARRMIAAARRSLEELGHGHGLLSTAMFGGLVELLGDDPVAAEKELRVAYDGFRALGVDVDAGQAAAYLARAVLAQDRADEAEALTVESERLGGADLKTAIAWRAARAEALARRDALDVALELAQAAVALATPTDALLDQADTHLALATVLKLAGRARDADVEARRAAELYERKGATVLVERARSLIGAAAPAHEAVVPAAARLRDVRPNAATRLWARMSEAVLARDARRLSALYADGYTHHDHAFHVSGSKTDVTEINDAVLELEEYRSRKEPLATLGERHGLARETFAMAGDVDRDRTVGGTELTKLVVGRVDAEGLLVRAERFAPDDLHLALARLLELHAEDELEGALRSASLRMAQHCRLLNPRDWHAVRDLVAENCVLVDHRAISTVGTLTGRSEVRASWDALHELIGDSDTRLVDVLAAAPTAGVIETLVRSVPEGAFEVRNLALIVVDRTGTMERLEWFSPEHVAEAIARFRELTKTRPLPNIVENLATSSVADVRAALAQRNWPALDAAIGQDIDDAGGIIERLKAFAERAGAEVSGRTVATRADRLQLSRESIRTDGAALDVLLAVEVNSAGRWTWVRAFDADDRDGAGDAIDARLAATDDSAWWDLMIRFRDGYRTRDWTVITAVLHPDFQVIDHRPTGWGTVGTQDFEELGSSLLQLSGDVRLDVWAVPLIHRNGAAFLTTASGTTDEGGAFELVRSGAVFVRDGFISRMEMFSPDELDRAISAVRAVEPEASAVRGGRFGLDNLALQHLRRIEHLTWPDVREHFSPDLVLADRRAGMGLTVSGADAFANLRLISESTQLLEVAPLAIRGDLLSLHAMRFGAGSDSGRHEWEMLHLLEVDRDGRAVFEASYDLDQLDAAFDELDDRYVASLPLETADVWSVGLRFANAYNGRAWADLWATISPDFICLDERPSGAGQLDKAGFQRFVQGLLDVAPDARLEAIEVPAVTASGFVAVSMIEGAGELVGASELFRIQVAVVRDGQITHLEYWPAEEVDAAVTRLRTLGAAVTTADEPAGSSDAATPQPNAATTFLGRYTTALLAQDWTVFAEMLAPDARIEDRRAATRSVISGKDALLRNALLLGNVITDRRCEIVATRGDRLVLYRSWWRGGDGTNGSFDVETLELGETDVDDRTILGVIFDPADLDAAFDELEKRFEEGEGAPYVRVLNVARRSYALWGVRAWDDLLDMFTDDAVMVDRRPVGWGTVDPAGLIERLRVLADLAPDGEMRGVALPRLNERASLGLMLGHGTDPEGGHFELSFYCLIVAEGDLVSRLEILRADDAAAAVARFDELTAPPPPQLWNLAGGRAEALADRLLARDWDGIADLLAQNAIAEDRRAGIAHVVQGRDGIVESYRAMAGVRAADGGVIATRGDRLVLFRVAWQGEIQGSPFEVENIAIIEVDQSSAITAVVSFDAANLDAAFAELDRRFLEGEGSPYAAVIELLRGAVAAHAAGDLDTFVALAEMAPDSSAHILALPRIGARGCVAVIRQAGTTLDGSSYELVGSIVMQVEGGVGTRLDYYGPDQLGLAVVQYDELVREA